MLNDLIVNISELTKAFMPVVTIYTQPIYFPRKHTVCSYRAQQRAAKKRRRAK